MSTNLNFEQEDLKGRDLETYRYIIPNNNFVNQTGGATALGQGFCIPVCTTAPSTAPVPLPPAGVALYVFCRADNKFYIYDNGAWIKSAASS